MSTDLHGLLGDLDPLETHRWEALQRGRVEFQRCAACGRAWLPPRAECPSCLGTEWAWEEASGRGELVSWVVYHRPFHPALAELVPYAVAIVELAEGPRMIAALAEDAPATGLRCAMKVKLETTERGSVMLAVARID
jgi:uncharacterized OB-fold protein